MVELVRDTTGGRGVDVVVDATGHPASFVPSLELLRDGGTLIEVGAFVDLGTVPVNPATILGRNLTIVGVAGEDARAYDRTLAMLAEHHDAVPFERAVTHTFPLSEAEQAMQTALGADTAMKVVITPSEVLTPSELDRLPAPHRHVPHRLTSRCDRCRRPLSVFACLVTFSGAWTSSSSFLRMPPSARGSTRWSTCAGTTRAARTSSATG